MRLAEICRDDLLPVATLLAQEAQVCADVAAELEGQWDNECQNLVAFSLASGIAQLLHLQRACLMECMATEGVVYVGQPATSSAP